MHAAFGATVLTRFAILVPRLVACAASADGQTRAVDDARDRLRRCELAEEMGLDSDDDQTNRYNRRALEGPRSQDANYANQSASIRAIRVPEFSKRVSMEPFELQERR